MVLTGPAIVADAVGMLAVRRPDAHLVLVAAVDAPVLLDPGALAEEQIGRGPVSDADLEHAAWAEGPAQAEEALAVRGRTVGELGNRRGQALAEEREEGFQRHLRRGGGLHHDVVRRGIVVRGLAGVAAAGRHGARQSREFVVVGHAHIGLDAAEFPELAAGVAFLGGKDDFHGDSRL